jgi:hypothetical protein
MLQRSLNAASLGSLPNTGTNLFHQSGAVSWHVLMRCSNGRTSTFPQRMQKPDIHPPKSDAIPLLGTIIGARG